MAIRDTFMGGGNLGYGSELEKFSDANTAFASHA